MSHVEVGSNTSTVALQVVGGDKKGVTSPMALRPDNECTGKTLLRKDYDRRCSTKKREIPAMSLKGVQRQDKLTGGKPPVLK
jgi:hypothetical protein